MRYSYIKSVFPNFENSNKIHDETLYNNIISLYKKTNDSTIEQNVESINDGKGYGSNVSDFAAKYVKQNPKPIQKDFVQKEPFNNTYTIEQQASISQPLDYNSNNNKQESQQKNLFYYNLPLNVDTLQQPLAKTKQNATGHTLENFENYKIETGCENYMKHLLECNKCKMIAMKQLSIDNERFRNEEIMEIISYIIFAIFILLLIDNLKNTKK